MGIKVDYYATERYEVKYLVRGIWYIEPFFQEEQALEFIDKNWDISWSDYILIKISHAIF